MGILIIPVGDWLWRRGWKCDFPRKGHGSTRFSDSPKLLGVIEVLTTLYETVNAKNEIKYMQCHCIVFVHDANGHECK